MNLKQLRETLESNPTKDFKVFILLSIAESLETIVRNTEPKKPKAPQKISPSIPKPETVDEIIDEVSREYILKAKVIDPVVLENKITLAKHWLLENPLKGKDSGWTIRTSRVMTFLQSFPDRKQNKDEQKISQISI